MALNHENHNTSDLVAHNDFSTFYATKEEIEKQKALRKKTGVDKSLKLFFLGTALLIPLSGLTSFLATAYVTNTLLAKAIMVAGPLTCSLFGMSNWFKYKKGVRQMNEELAKEDEEEKKL